MNSARPTGLIFQIQPSLMAIGAMPAVWDVASDQVAYSLFFKFLE